MLENLLARLDQVPHPNENDQLRQIRLGERIVIELNWSNFANKFRQLESSGDFKAAATYLRSWTAGKNREVARLREEFTSTLKTALSAPDRNVLFSAR